MKSSALSAPVPALDGLRGVAILLVLIFHLVALRPPAATSTVSALLLRLASAGWAGVDLFFVLSGYLITGLLLDRRGEPGFFRRFWTRRALRILPLYYLFLFVLLVALRGTLDGAAGYAEALSSQRWFWFHLQNWKMLAWSRFPLFDPLRPLWSLAVEEQFYLVWPALVWWLGPKRLGPLCLALIATASLARVGLWLWPGNHSIFGAYVATPTRLDSLAAGALLAVLAREETGLSACAKRAPAVIAATLVLLLSMFARGMLWFTSLNGQLAGVPLLWLLFGATLVLAVTLPRTHLFVRTLETSPLRWTGRVSYGIYLLHLLVLDGLLALWPAIPLPAFYGLGVGLTFLAAALSWSLFERPILGLKARLAP